jgi:hypothetical protein
LWTGKKAESARVKYWEIIADNFSNAGWSWATSQAWIPTGEQSSLLTQLAATVNALLCVQVKSWTAFVELESAIRAVSR